jgi:type IV fimbrial biogenesis protein FimT
VRRLNTHHPGNPGWAAAGFTVTELMVTVAVFALLAALAVPTMRTAIANSRIRATGVSLQNGLALARAEAVRLNTQVQFTLTGTGWNIQRTDNGNLLQQASGKERAAGLTVTATPTSTVSFDALGRRVGATLTGIAIAATNPPSSGHKPLRVQLVPGGTARLCDTAVASTEPRACLPEL